MSKMVKELKKLLKESNNELEKYCINDLLEHETEEEITSYINDLLQHGCVSGMVGALIYYNDTVKFYKQYNSEINELLYETLQETGLSINELFGDKFYSDDPLVIDQMNQNLLAWFGYEEMIRKIGYKLELEI